MAASDPRRTTWLGPSPSRRAFGDNDCPSAIVLSHDEMFDGDNTDFDAWCGTYFLPAVVIANSGNEIFDSFDALRTYFVRLVARAAELGIFRIRTEIKSVVKTGENIATMNSFRERLGADGQVMGRTSITWTLIREREAWKINQVHMNDERLDPLLSFIRPKEGRAE